MPLILQSNKYTVHKNIPQQYWPKVWLRKNPDELNWIGKYAEENGGPMDDNEIIHNIALCNTAIK